MHVSTAVSHDSSVTETEVADRPAVQEPAVAVAAESVAPAAALALPAVAQPSAAPTAAPVPLAPPPAPVLQLLDRDLSIMAFNARVLSWAMREDVPLLERLRFLTIVSSNLDEFNEVRAAPLVTAMRSAIEQGAAMPQALQTLADHTHALVEQQYRIYNESIGPAFKKVGIRVVPHRERSDAQKEWVRNYFLKEVQPLLVPVGLDPAHPFPKVANKSLNFIVRLQGSDAFGRHNDVAILRVPRALPRLVPMPAKVTDGKRLFVSLTSIVRAHLRELFPGRKVQELSQFRVTRHSDLSVDEEDVLNLRTALRQGLHHRHYGMAVRLEVDFGCSDTLAQMLLSQFSLPPQVLFRVKGPVNLVRLAQLIDLVDDPQLLFPAWRPRWPRQLAHGASIMAQMRKRDVLIHQPFESFDGVLALLREAVNDPQVLVIKQTIYRTGANSELMRLLAEAVRRGKEVMAVVELKARFDEEANINGAEALEDVGAQVVYGVVGLKTHAKMLLITRREGKRLRRYGHLSTGNYNERTARIYTDLGYLTADETTTADMDAVFSHLANQNHMPQLQRLVMAPFALHTCMLELMAKTTEAARQGKYARIVVKMNALTDEELIRALVVAGQAGVKIDLVVRGACMLPPQLAGWTENIRVRSVIGRFLEHTRVFYFGWGTHEQLYLSSADWMSRNLHRRVELAWPVTDPDLRQQIIDECLVSYLHDDRDAWSLQPDGRYLPPPHPQDGLGAQNALMQRYTGG